MSVQDFKHRLRVARAIMPARRKRAKLPRKVPPRSVALSYYRAISPILERARQAVERAMESLLPALERQAAEIRGDAVDGSERVDANINDVLDAVGEEFFKRLKPVEIEALAEKFARATSEWEKEQAIKQVRAAFGVDVLAREPNIAAKSGAFVSENVALIKSIPSQYFDDVEKRVARAVARGATPKELADEIKKAHGVADDRAMLIARDQIGKYYGQVAQARQAAMGVTHFIWRTSNDERVREEHAALEGQRFAWDDLPDEGAPGYGSINCRCFAEPDLSALLEGDEPHAQEIASREEKPVAPAVETAARVPTPEDQQAFTAAAQERLGIPLGESNLQTALAPPAASGLELKVQLTDVHPNRLEVEAAITREGKQVGTITRSFGRDTEGTRWVKHQDFALNPAEQGRGVGEAIVRKSIDEFRRLGFDEIRLTATDVGRYAWAKMGFQWDEATALKMEAALPEFLSRRGVTVSADRVRELARDPQGLASLKHEGIAVGKEFLLSPAVPRWNGVLDLREP